MDLVIHTIRHIERVTPLGRIRVPSNAQKGVRKLDDLDLKLIVTNVVTNMSSWEAELI